MIFEDLKDKTIIVFGACGRIGRAVTVAMEGAGAWVVAVDLDARALEELALANGEKHVVDISDRNALRELFARFANSGAKPCAAVNACYPIGKNYGADFFDVEYDDFCDNVSRHLGGFFVVMQACAEYSLTEQSAFSLVNLSSIYGVTAPRLDIYEQTNMTMPIEYAAIKAGIQHMQAFVTSYTKGSLFRVNSVSPGGILDNQPARFLAAYQSYSRSKGMLDAEDITGGILFLCSSASSYICGQNVVIDDGFTLGGRR
ncbi:MAG: SDR family oxidoreductase [Natronospirillum sp.]